MKNEELSRAIGLRRNLHIHDQLYDNTKSHAIQGPKLSSIIIISPTGVILAAGSPPGPQS